MKILIAEDDAELAQAIADYLETQGAETDFAYHGEAALRFALQTPPELMILDLMLPGKSGFEVCRELRSLGSRVPVLMLTAFDTPEEQLEGFRSGIDDFVAKPCPMPILWARLQALRRRAQPSADRMTIGPLELDFDQYRASREGRELKLTPTSWRIVEYLARRSPKLVPRNELALHLWPDNDGDLGNLNVQLHQLRKTLDKPFELEVLKSVPGFGITLKEPDRND